MTKDPGWAILCDFDGTISVEDVTDALLERFARPAWRALEQRWIAGEIGSGECMRGQVALLDMSRGELDEFLDGVAIDPRFAAFASGVARLGIPLAIASDGLDAAIDRILRRNGLAGLPVRANRLEQVGEREWRLTSPHSSAACAGACGTCKCQLRAASAHSGRKVMFIGDGRSDYCVAGEADFVLAKAALLDHCVRNGIAHAPFEDFGDALARVVETVARARASA